MKRLAGFLRSVLPADLTQLLFLFGIGFLFIGSHSRWWPLDESWTTVPFWRPVFLVSEFLLIFASLAGLFLAFWPVRRPITRISYLVCLPALAGITLFSTFSLYNLRGPSSVLEASSLSTRSLDWLLSTLWKFGPGFRLDLLGLVLVLLFSSRLALGIASVPLALPESSIHFPGDSASWSRVQRFVWVLIAQTPIALWSFFVWSLLLLVVSRLHAFQIEIVQNAFIPGALFVFIQSTTQAGVAVWLLGKEAWSMWRRSLRLPLPESFVLAAAIPVGISAAVSLGRYILDRLFWFTDRNQVAVPPPVASYFRLPEAIGFSLLFFAFYEEMIFRGLLQPYLVRRYGTLRGIFLVGIVFAAWHFNDDFTVRLSGTHALLQLGLRLWVCLALSFVLGWLALKTKSIFPSTLAHMLYNVFVLSPPGPNFPEITLVTTGLWGILAYTLFRYWPAQTETLPQMPD